MTNYTLLKAELDVLMVYENEYEAVAQVLVKCNYPTEIERWVWVGDTLLKQGPAMAPQVASVDAALQGLANSPGAIQQLAAGMAQQGMAPQPMAPAMGLPTQVTPGMGPNVDTQAAQSAALQGQQALQFCGWCVALVRVVASWK